MNGATFPTTGVAALPTTAPNANAVFDNVALVNSQRISIVSERLAMCAQSNSPNGATYFFNLCISLSRGIDFAIANNEIPAQVSNLPKVCKLVCQRKKDCNLQAAIMVLMVTMKHACNAQWFSTEETQELLALAEEAPRRASTILFAPPRKRSALDFEQVSGSRLIKAPGCALTRKRVTPSIVIAPKTKKSAQYLNPMPMIKRGLPVYLLFEFASGYALFLPHNVDEVGDIFESTEEYIKRYNKVFKLVAFYPFASAADALCQLNALSKSIVTEELKDFLVHNLPKLNLADLNYFLSTADPVLLHNILIATKIAMRGGVRLLGVLRGLRTNICEFIDLKPADLEKAQRDLALSYSRQRCKSTYKGNSMAANSSSSSFNGEVVVVPHRIEGVFIAKGKNEDAICTKNLVPGEAVYGEELISVKNKDGTETEYRVWNPSRSKLAGAIQSGVNNIWVKPGSRVLYMGDVCGTTVSHLSDLVGPDGLVYALGLSNVVVNMAEKRSNVIAIYEEYFPPLKYRMFLSMVDVICADPTFPFQVHFVALNAVQYLRAGGHFLISTQADAIVSTVQSEAMFSCVSIIRQREFKLLETIKLEQGLVMAVGCFRMLDA